MASPKVLKTLAAMGELYSKEISATAAGILADDLADYPEPAVISALSRCRRELRQFPTLAEIIARIDDGRPGPEEAWAMIPQGEEGSVIWSDEMAQAFGVARELLAVGDPVAARMAFKETYTTLLNQAREQRRPVRWSPSFGFTREGRIEAVVNAIAKGRISDGEARKLLPDFETEIRPRIGSQGLGRIDFRGMIPPEVPA